MLIASTSSVSSHCGSVVIVAFGQAEPLVKGMRCPHNGSPCNVSVRTRKYKPDEI